MQNKEELEKLVEQVEQILMRNMPLDNSFEHRENVAREIVALADTQAYQRGILEAMKIVGTLIENGPHEWMKDSPYSHTRRAYGEVLVSLSQVRDAITKLEGNNDENML